MTTWHSDPVLYELNTAAWLHDVGLKVQSDELGQDFHVSTMVLYEYGDSQLDGSEFLNVGPTTIRHEPTVSGFARAILDHLSAEERQRLLEEIREGQGVS